MAVVELVNGVPSAQKVPLCPVVDAFETVNKAADVDILIEAPETPELIENIVEPVLTAMNGPPVKGKLVNAQFVAPILIKVCGGYLS